MNFAIVRFTKEGGPPGIVPTNWLSKRKDICLFPNVCHERTKNELLLARTEPADNWFKCPVTFLREFSSYQRAKNWISDAEITSNLESDTENTRSPQKRRRVVSLQVEESSDDETECRQIFDGYPVPSARKSSQSQAVERTISENINESLVESVDISGPSNRNEEIFETLSPLEHSEHPISVNLCPQSNQEHLNQLQRSVLEIQNDQKNLWKVNSEISVVLRRIEAKVDILLTKNIENSDSNESLNDKELALLTSLPVGTEGFNKLNDLINENQTFRQRLKKMLLDTGGKDVKALTYNLLKKVALDDIADFYSLTGKSSSGQKLAFDKTGVYKIISEICICLYGKPQEILSRQTISDWLMQAKFRKSRREHRKNAHANVPGSL